MKKSSDKSPVRQHDTATQINSDAVSSSTSFTDSDSTCSFLTPSMEFPDRISFRRIDFSEAAPTGVVLPSTSSELTRSNSSENKIPNEDISVSTSSRYLVFDKILALMKKSPGRRGDKTSPARRLDRSDAVRRNIDYDAGEDSSSLLITRSLDFPNRTSFRVDGVDDGEIDRIYRYIGVSGPEDFAISSDAWKVRKEHERSSSDVVNKLKSLDLDSREAGPSGVVVASSSMNHKFQGHDLSEAGSIGVVVASNFTLSESNKIENLNSLRDKEIVDGDTVENRCGIERKLTILVKSRGYLVHNDEVGVGGGIKGVRPPVLNVPRADKEVVDGGKVESKSSIERKPTILVKTKGYLVSNDVVAVGGVIKRVTPPVLNLPADKEFVDGGMVENGRGIGGGIKGVRPSVLKPPPVMKLPPVDLPGSSWDILTHFAPDSEIVRRPSSSSSSENDCDEEDAEDDKVEKEETGDMFIQLDDTTDEACSFTTNEGDSSSTVSNTSPICVSGGSINTSWQKGQLLRQGSFGSVYEAISEDGDFFAVKEVSLLDQGSQAQECIQQLEGEIALLSQLKHQNILRYRGTDKDESNLYIFLELVTQGSLLELYRRYQLRDSLVSLYTKQILDGLKYLHHKGFIHRDIKCATILVDANGTVKLADFGLAKVSKLNDIKSCKETLFWMAPEVINRKDSDGYGSPADIWSLGCTVLEMCTGQIPYSDLEPIQAIFRIGRGTLPDVPDTLSLDARHFILKCLKLNPEERPTAAELLNHPFVRRPLPSSGSGSTSPLIRR
ncbi:putative mitogen-activated protein kinase kinase kinase 9 STE-STE11 family [Arabidopsis thaliana]|uniref:Protein kinase-like domain superfamily n=1 Tax=Arabidopsis thaliana x Arabidopsis arenosa TaxID=1240361 RepID=A0A8T2DXU1_9BRAS|nr:Protein kinase-like domain superfamily [Arabidopsis thaliana x Arabidopsis arenosa]